jgi:hypothetical protein
MRGQNLALHKWDGEFIASPNHLRSAQRETRKAAHLKHASELLHTLQHQLLMSEHLSALHDAHNGCINGVPPVFVHVLDHLLLLVHRRQGHLQRPGSTCEPGDARAFETTTPPPLLPIHNGAGQALGRTADRNRIVWPR